VHKVTVTDDIFAQHTFRPHCPHRPEGIDARIAMKLPALAMTCILLSGFGPARADGLDVCDVESDYDLRVGPASLTFERDGAAPRRVEMRGGRLSIDSVEVPLSAADGARIAEFESLVRAAIPEVKAIAIEAVGIATEAVVQVATTFSADRSAATLKRIERLSDDLSKRVQASADSADWRDAEFETAVEALVEELVPAMAGDVAAIAIKVALSGDETAIRDLEARAERMEKAIEAGVEKRAAALERRADKLCPRLVALDRLESELTLRLTDNARLDLLQIER
jgi:hypothetical protein